MSNQDQTGGVNLTQTQPPPQTQFQSQPVSTPAGIEMEVTPAGEPLMEEANEYEVPKEVASHVQKTSETIELPPDLKKIGLQVPPAQTSALQLQTNGKTLPLTDDQIGIGLNADIKTSVRWWSVWCLKQLKKMHLTLKKVGEHFVREKYAK